MAKPPAQPKKAAAAPKKATAAAKAGRKETAAAAAKKRADVQEVAKRKEVIADVAVAGTVVDVTDAAAPLTDSTNAPTPAAAPTLVYSTTNNNRTRARQAAEAEKAAKEQEAKDALANQAKKGWFEGMDSNGGTTVTFTRARKQRVLPDGSTATLPVVKTRAKRPDPTEAALLARTKEGGNAKRKATEPKTRAGTSKK
jgi:hypothetical protein